LVCSLLFFFNFVPVNWFLACRLHLPVLPATTHSRATVSSDVHSVSRPGSSSVLICKKFYF
jgi:hypothetical protein